jgi:hypothetical protein
VGKILFACEPKRINNTADQHALICVPGVVSSLTHLNWYISNDVTFSDVCEKITDLLWLTCVSWKLPWQINRHLWVFLTNKKVRLMSWRYYYLIVCKLCSWAVVSVTIRCSSCLNRCLGVASFGDVFRVNRFEQSNPASWLSLTEKFPSFSNNSVLLSFHSSLLFFQSFSSSVMIRRFSRIHCNLTNLNVRHWISRGFSFITLALFSP